MLKRLEMLGFKSFADKTAIEFGPGITCIVGPNGSGKSNVVDAIRWVLGEQSAKSLRGSEMADVIFNGSATRRSLGFAEATVTLDNRSRLLPVDADEVQLTRRVHRSGEGEYLINKNAARLRDFRDLTAGTGAGTEAYSVIEQGKVDVLLQSSTKDRRALFEEAAGISRFKARKLEAIRKLEHVTQNLLRLSDIIEEVGKQLRSVKLQAAKARRYQEHSERLRELRVKVSLADYHAITTQFDGLEQKIAAITQEVAIDAGRCDSVDAKLIQVQSLIEDLDNAIRALEAAITEVRQDIARLESQIAYERAHARDLNAQIERLRRQWKEFASRVGELETHVGRVRGEVAAVEARYEAGRLAVDAEAQAVARLHDEIESQRSELEQAKHRLLDQMQAGNELRNELSALESQDRTLAAQRQRLVGRCSTLAAPIEQLGAQVASLAAEEDAAATEREEAERALGELGERLRGLRARCQEMAAQLATQRERRSAIAARSELLEDLERRREGVGQGVQQALATPELVPHVVGLVADLLHADLEHAPWVDLALGPRSQHIVVRNQSAIVEWLGREPARFEGPVSLLPLDAIAPAAAAVPLELEQHPTFVARADKLVHAADGFEKLAGHLLGGTVVVRDLSAALDMARGAGRGLRFVTPAGHVLQPDGTVTTGNPHAQSGLISRKSQLRSLRDELLSLDADIAAGEQELARYAGSVAELERDEQSFDGRVAAASERAAQIRSQLGQRRQQLASLEEELGNHRAEIDAIDRDLGALADQRAAIQGRLAECAAAVRAIEQLVADQEAAIAARVVHADERQSELVAAKVELAKTEGHLTGLRQRLASITADLDERRRVERETLDQVRATVERERDCQRKVLCASGQIAELYLRKEKLSREVVGRINHRESFREQRQSLAAEGHEARERLQQVQADLHQRELEASDLRHQRTSLIERLREDYEIELPELYKSWAPDPTFDREAQQPEIQELRRKIAALGNVNLEALTELAELETRSATLHAQLDDLNQSKATLDEIIRKINDDSRRLFMETLEAIRGHFGELFRKLFGGGRADIVLENEGDVLESGIDIVARPPGKELRSISLLSGGEKTLTAVALLLAVFKSRPSPFCVLDEVDAALDEANIDRFTSVLREFAAQWQFIMITHSKKTMIASDVLYGVTMQESGVSKRVSVRFEDVNERGEISDAALQRAKAEEPPQAPAPAAEQEAA